MKKVLIISIALLMIAVGFTGCAGKSTSEVETNQTEVAENKVEETKEATTEATEEKSEEATEEKATEEKATEEETEESLVDKSLSGLALVKSIVANPEKEFVMTSELTMADASVSTTTTYTKGQSTRMETESALTEGKMIMIYNADEGATYQYTDGETTGILMLDGEEDMDMDMSAPTLKDLVNASSEDMTAKMDTLDGEEVIYIEATEADEDMGEVNVYMWYSVKYSIPLKYEMHMNGQVMMSSRVTKIDVESKIDEALFQKPEGVEFQEFSFDTMFGD